MELLIDSTARLINSLGRGNGYSIIALRAARRNVRIFAPHNDELISIINDLTLAINGFLPINTPDYDFDLDDLIDDFLDLVNICY